MKAINYINVNIYSTGRPTYIYFYISKKVPIYYMKVEDSCDRFRSLPDHKDSK